MQLVRNPGQFDVIVTSNLFGDILSDEASMLTGSIGMLPSASLGSGRLGMYEPIHGSAPDIAGQNLANPIATIASAAMLLRYSLGEGAAADAIEAAINQTLDAGYRTADILDAATSPTHLLPTSAWGDKLPPVCSHKKSPSRLFLFHIFIGDGNCAVIHRYIVDNIEGGCHPVPRQFEETAPPSGKMLSVFATSTRNGVAIVIRIPIAEGDVQRSSRSCEFHALPLPDSPQHPPERPVPMSIRDTSIIGNLRACIRVKVFTAIFLSGEMVNSIPSANSDRVPVETST